MPVREAQLPFREQIAFFKAKTGVPTATWRDVWKAGHDRSFMVAGAVQADLVEDFRRAIEEAISEGTGYAAFREKFDDIVERHGWSYNGSPGWRSRVIYKTNMQTSYQAGRFKQMKDIADRRPYWIYRHSDFVAEPRPHHLAWDGDVRRHDDPWWDVHYPPNGWGCKCRAFSISRTELERRGLTVKSGDPDGGAVDPKTGELPGIDEGWGYTPGRSVAEDLSRIAGAKARRLRPPVRGQFQRAVAAIPDPPDPPLGIPEFVGAATVAEARKHAEKLVKSEGKPYVKDPSGQPAVRYRHGRTTGQRVADRLYGKASFAKMELPAANVTAETLTELARESDRLKIPRPRGVTTAAGGAAGRMGDGILAVNAGYFNRLHQRADLDTVLRQRKLIVQGFNDRLERGGMDTRTELDMIKRRNELQKEIDDLEAGRVDLREVVFPPSKWKPGDAPSGRPHTVESYFPDPSDKLRSMMYHEFGHHVHQQRDVTTYAEYRSPPMEKRLAELYRNRERGRAPSAYAETKPVEWWAENYAAYKMGREDLVDPVLLKLIKEELE